MHTKQCQQCSKTFRIEDQDLAFYKKIDVPEPTHCPDCRQQRRAARRNERKLYARQCDLCHANIITIYSPDKPYTVYCSDCWWSDKWDPYSYGQVYQSGKSFFEQFKQLQLQVPRIALYGKNNDNSPYTNHSDGAKNCYLDVDAGFCDNVHYSKWMISCADCVDCYQLEKAQLSYESLYSVNVHQIVSTLFSDSTNNTWFTYHSEGASNCFLTTNKPKQQYVFKNQQLTVEAYQAKLKTIDMGSYQTFSHYQNEFKDLLKTAVRRYAELISSENCTGDNIYHCQNVSASFDVIESSQAKYCYDAGHLKDSYDVYESAFDCELQYEMHGCNRTKFSKFSSVCYDNSFIEYCDMCHNSQSLFGCIGIRNGKYTILNKQYNEADFKILQAQIIHDMKVGGEYGEFFPIHLSPFCYNETAAQEFYSLSQVQVQTNGWIWQEDKPVHTVAGLQIVRATDLPDNINAISVDIIQQAITCLRCTKLFRYVPAEIIFYKKLVVPLPRLCPDCRHLDRMRLRNPRQLWQRQCMCTQTDHKHNGRCGIQFETTYSPERVEIVYCEQCYQKEIY